MKAFLATSFVFFVPFVSFVPFVPSRSLPRPSPARPCFASFVSFVPFVPSSQQTRLAMSARGVAGLGNAQVRGRGRIGSGKRGQSGKRKEATKERFRRRRATSDDCSPFLRRRSNALSCPLMPPSSPRGVASHLLSRSEPKLSELAFLYAQTTRLISPPPWRPFSSEKKNFSDGKRKNNRLPSPRRCWPASRSSAAPLPAGVARWPPLLSRAARSAPPRPSRGRSPRKKRSSPLKSTHRLRFLLPPLLLLLRFRPSASFPRSPTSRTSSPSATPAG